MRKDYAPQFDAKPKPKPKTHWLEKAADTIFGAVAIMSVGCLFGMLMLAWLGLL